MKIWNALSTIARAVLPRARSQQQELFDIVHSRWFRGVMDPDSLPTRCFQWNPGIPVFPVVPDAELPSRIPYSAVVALAYDQDLPGTTPADRRVIAFGYLCHYQPHRYWFDRDALCFWLRHNYPTTDASVWALADSACRAAAGTPVARNEQGGEGCQ